MKKDFLSVNDLSAKEMADLLDLTGQLKKNKAKFSKVLSAKTLALIFQKPSNRTRVSFDVGMYQLGGNSVYLAPNEINLGVRESIEDVAKTLSRYCDGVVLRTFEHENCLQMAKFSGIPVINGLSDLEHPCQALADIFTVKEKLKDLKGKTLSYIGDGNNVCNSLLLACAKAGMNMNVGCPKGYVPDNSCLTEARKIAKANNAFVHIFDNPFNAAKDADVLYTDVWASMGQEKEAAARKKIFKDFQVNRNLVRLARKNALIMHCLPAHRGEEISADVIDSPNSVVFDQAENRMHAQKAVLIKLLGDK